MYCRYISGTFISEILEIWPIFGGASFVVSLLTIIQTILKIRKNICSARTMKMSRYTHRSRGCECMARGEFAFYFSHHFPTVHNKSCLFCRPCIIDHHSVCVRIWFLPIYIFFCIDAVLELSISLRDSSKLDRHIGSLGLYTLSVVWIIFVSHRKNAQSVSQQTTKTSKYEIQNVRLYFCINIWTDNRTIGYLPF